MSEPTLIYSIRIIIGYLYINYRPLRHANRQRRKTRIEQRILSHNRAIKLPQKVEKLIFKRTTFTFELKKAVKTFDAQFVANAQPNKYARQFTSIAKKKLWRAQQHKSRRYSYQY